MKNIAFVFVFVLCNSVSSAQQIIDLYAKEIPNSKTNLNYVEKADTVADKSIRIQKVTKPQLIAYFPEKPNGTAVVVCPGGAYLFLSITNEGTSIAKAFAEQGITAFILKYRLPSDEIMIDKTIGPLQDAQQAIKLIREQASNWKLDTSKIGVIGFSAGGHLVSTVETHFKKSYIDNPKNTNLRPDFAILGYPVVSMGEFTHKGSKKNLLGNEPNAQLINLFSGEFQVSSETPPTFLFHSIDDKTVPVENSIQMLQALKKMEVKSEMHLYQSGGHGYGLNNKSTQDKWFERMINWLKTNKFIN